MVEESGNDSNGDLQLVRDCSHRNSHRQRHTSGNSNYDVNPQFCQPYLQPNSYNQNHDPHNKMYFESLYPYEWQISEEHVIDKRERTNPMSKRNICYEEAQDPNLAAKDSDLKPSRNCSHRRQSLRMHSTCKPQDASIITCDNGVGEGSYGAGLVTSQGLGNNFVNTFENQKHLQWCFTEPLNNSESLDIQWLQEIHRIEQEALDSDLKPSVNCNHRGRHRQSYSDQVNNICNGFSNEEIFNNTCDETSPENSDLKQMFNHSQRYNRKMRRQEKDTLLNDSVGTINSSFDDAVSMQSDLKPSLNCRHRRSKVRDYCNRSSDYFGSNECIKDISCNETALIDGQLDLTQSLDVGHRRASSMYKTSADKSYPQCNKAVDAFEFQRHLQPYYTETTTNTGPFFENESRPRQVNRHFLHNLASPSNQSLQYKNSSHCNNQSLQYKNSSHCNYEKFNTECGLSRSFDSGISQRGQVSSDTQNSSFDSACNKSYNLVITKNKLRRRNRLGQNKKNEESPCLKQKQSNDKVDKISRETGKDSSINSKSRVKRISRRRKSDICEQNDIANSNSVVTDIVSKENCIGLGKVNVGVDHKEKDGRENEVPTKDRASERCSEKSNETDKIEKAIEKSKNEKRQRRKRFRSGSDSSIIISHKRRSHDFYNEINIGKNDSSEQAFAYSNEVLDPNALRVDCNKVLSAYEIHRHLERYCNQPLTHENKTGVPQRYENGVLSEKVSAKKTVMNSTTQSPKTVGFECNEKQREKSVNKSELDTHSDKVFARRKTAKRRSWPREDKKLQMIQKLHKTLAKFNLNEGKFGASCENKKSARLQLSELETMMPLSGIKSGMERQAKYKTSMKQKGVMHRNEDGCAIWEGVMSKFVS